MTTFVIRVRICQPDGIGYLCTDGTAVRDLKWAHKLAKFSSEAEAWDYLNMSSERGRDERGEWSWVEEL